MGRFMRGLYMLGRGNDHEHDTHPVQAGVASDPSGGRLPSRDYVPSWDWASGQEPLTELEGLDGSPWLRWMLQHCRIRTRRDRAWREAGSKAFHNTSLRTMWEASDRRWDAVLVWGQVGRDALRTGRIMFQKRHYEAIAETIRINWFFPDDREDAARAFAKLFREDNRAFRKDRFMTACGVPGYDTALELPAGL